MPQAGTIDQQLLMDQADQQQAAGELRQEKQKGRILRGAGKGAKAGGTAMQTGGAAAQVGGKAAEVTGKGIKTAGKAGRKAGTAMMRAGAEMSSTGVGAIVGIPLMAVGGATAAAGTAAEAGGKGVEVAGKGVNKTGKAIKNTGKKVKGIGKEMNIAAELRAGKIGQAIPGGGTISGSGSSIIKSKVSDYIIDAIPGVGPFRIFKNFLSGKIVKVGLARIFIILFTNIEFVLIILAILAFIVMIVYFFDTSLVEKVKIIWESIKSFFSAFTGLAGWKAIIAMVKLFKSAYSL